MGSGVVIFGSFGTQAESSNVPMDEIALGLEMAGQLFVWVITSTTWVPPIMVPQKRDGGENKILIVHRDVICDRVNELMRGDQVARARERAQDLGRMARQAIEKSRSSNKKLDELVECLILTQKKQNTIKAPNYGQIRGSF